MQKRESTGVAKAREDVVEPKPSSRRERWSYQRYLWPTFRRRLQSSQRPILVGPWHGEVGFEALYWLPWLSRLRHDLGIAPERWIPITRGGMGLLYDAPTSLELFEMRTPQDVRVANQRQFRETGQMKQRFWTAFDRAILADAKQTLGLPDALVLHPSWMYHDLESFWQGRTGVQRLLDKTRYQTLAPPIVDQLQLPEKFVAVRFYFRPTFPTTPLMISFAKETIKHLAQQVPVVIVNSGQHIDDHLDYLPTDRTNVQVLSEMIPMSVGNNLACQAAVIGKAMGYAGTYGGMAQLALRLGRPVVSVYDEWHSTAMAHRELSVSLALSAKIPFHVLRVGDLPLLQDVLPRVVLQTAAGASSKARA